jgi:Concanavalin A-like lectin/glucanases superfamily
VAACQMGMCKLTGCAKDYTDCDNNLANGCEGKLQSDPRNCGMCGKVCPPAGANQMAACLNGACSLACNAGFGDCDGNPGNGCELDVTADPKNCGACNNVCPQNLPVCKAGQCVMGCNYAAEVLALNPIGYWPLDELQGPTAFDKSAMPHNGAVQSAPQYGVSGVAGTAYLFHGNNDHIRVGPVTSQTTTAVSYEAWVKISANPGAALTIFWDDDGQGGGDAWVEVTPTGQLQARRSPDGFVDFLSNGSLKVGSWNQVVLVCDGAGKRFYLNGQLDNSTNTQMNARTNRSYLTIGANWDGNFYPGGAQYWSGSIDEVSIYGRALTAMEIATHYANACGK